MVCYLWLRSKYTSIFSLFKTYFSAPPPKPFSIAILLEHLTSHKKTFCKALESYLREKGLDVSVDVFESHSITALSKKHARDASSLTASYDLIVCSGIFSTLIMQEQLHKIKSTLPIVYTHVYKEELAALLPRSAYPYITGVTTTRNRKEDISTLSFLHHNISHLFLIRPSLLPKWLQPEYESLITSLEKNTIPYTLLFATDRKDLILSDYEKIKTGEAVLILQNTLSMQSMEKLQFIARKHKITVCYSEADNLVYGAAIGFGTSAFEIASCTASIIEQYLRYNVPIYTLKELVACPRPFVVIDSSYAKEQGVELDDKKLFLLRRASPNTNRINI